MLSMQRKRKKSRETALGNEIRKELERKVPRTWTLRPSVLLCPNTPKHLHGVVPREIMGAAWWNETRRRAYASTAYHCIACGVYKYQAKARKWLEGHEIYDVDYQKGLWTYVETVPLCHYCHNYIHDGRMLALLRKGQMTHGKYASIIQHGDSVLAGAGLFRLTHAERDKLITNATKEGKIAEWSKWRLVLGNKKYPPKYKTFIQWHKAFANG